MTTFRSTLEEKISESLYNNYGVENYDEYRFGKYVPRQDSLMTELKRKFKRIIGYRKNELAGNKLFEIDIYIDRFQFIWERLNQESKRLLVELIAFRMLGHTRIKLTLNNKKYWDSLETAKKLKVNNETIDPHFMHLVLEHFDLRSIGYDLELFFSEAGILVDFIIEQYSYKIDGKPIVEVEKGDYVLDIGGCWGDTALYFADKAGEKGKVFSFEFIPDNIKIHNINTDLNPNLKSVINLISSPVSNISGQTIYFKDEGPGSKISTSPFATQTGLTTTISIDDFIKQNNVLKVDFIKMDIEGAEPKALEGALETIKKFKPKLAIAIYHGMEDFVNIPKWLMDLNLGYDFYLGHYTIHAEETIIFAKPRN